MKRPDQELLQFIGEKNQSAFVEFYTKYIRIIYKFVFERVKNQQIADDLIQDFWLKLWDNPSFLCCDAKGCAKTYLLNNFRFRIIDLYHSSLFNTVSLEEYNLTEEDHEWYAHVTDGIEEREIVEIVNEALRDETDTMRNVFWMRMNDASSQETAESLDISLRTVYNNYHESCQIVKSHLLNHHPDVVADIKRKASTSEVSSAVGVLVGLLFHL